MAGLREHQGIEIPQQLSLCNETIFLEIDCLLSWRPKSFLLATLVLQSILVITVILRQIVSVFKRKEKKNVDIDVGIPRLLLMA